jgi:hypothetical protein
MSEVSTVPTVPTVSYFNAIHFSNCTHAARAHVGLKLENARTVGTTRTNPRFLLEIEHLPSDVPDHIQLRKLLKRLLRQCGFRCISIEESNGDNDIDRTGTEDTRATQEGKGAGAGEAIGRTRVGTSTRRRRAGRGVTSAAACADTGGSVDVGRKALAGLLCGVGRDDETKIGKVQSQGLRGNP